jgi:hypothetical protein
MKKKSVELKQSGLESIWVKIHTKGVDILFGLFYRPPDSENYIWDHINHSIDVAMNTNIDRIVICSDINEDQLNRRKMQIENICLQNNLVQIINNSTFYCKTSSSLLDLVMINDPDIVIYSEVGENILDNSIRFHYPISGIINVEKCNNKTFKRKVWQYHRGNYEQYTDILWNTDWDYLIDNTDLDTAVDNVTNTIFNAAEIAIPNKTVCIRKHDLPWINGSIHKLIRKRRWLCNKAKRTNYENDWSNYRKVRNKCVGLVRTAKDEYLDKQAAILDFPIPFY